LAEADFSFPREFVSGRNEHGKTPKFMIETTEAQAKKRTPGAGQKFGRSRFYSRIFWDSNFFQRSWQKKSSPGKGPGIALEQKSPHGYISPATGTGKGASNFRKQVAPTQLRFTITFYSGHPGKLG